ncbi:MAG: hypothetical protein HY815_27120 [Candidatus Riflebacteria bacterium]|nr:hypothetical protein [Candidatus Riflebacteria bacterium]
MTALQVVAMALFFGLAGRVLAHDEPLIPMPADIPPHHARTIVGERHHDISNKPELVHHWSDHYISYGHHNYDLTGDPSMRNRYPYEKRRYRGMGQGEDERFLICMKAFDQIPERCLAGQTRPSWAVIYKRKRR